MKKILFACLTASVLFLFSCSNEKSEEKKIVGTWECYLLEEVYGDETEREEYAPGEITITFNADGTFSATVDENGDLSGSLENGRYSMSDGKLIITYEGDSIVLTIDKLTKKDLIAYEKYSEGGFTYRATYYLRKK